MVVLIIRALLFRFCSWAQCHARVKHLGPLFLETPTRKLKRGPLQMTVLLEGLLFRFQGRLGGVQPEATTPCYFNVHAAA